MAPRRSAIVALPCTIGLEGTDCVSCFRPADAPVAPGKLEEIGEQLMAMLRGDALGMELYAVHRVALMPHAHDEAIVGRRRDLALLRQARPLADQRVVQRRREHVLHV